MFPFWKPVLAPVLAAAEVRRVVEIGALRGDNTREIIETLGPDSVLHVIDPVPGFDPSEHEREFPGRYVFHQALSLDVLGDLPPMDAALIDGDHNWYTVFHELRLLTEGARRHDAPLPLLVLHDVGWPYGRRDLYYDPDTIPAEFRHPHRQAGMRPGRSELVAGGGMSAGLWNAEHEGGRATACAPRSTTGSPATIARCARCSCRSTSGWRSSPRRSAWRANPASSPRWTTSRAPRGAWRSSSWVRPSASGPWPSTTRWWPISGARWPIAPTRIGVAGSMTTAPDPLGRGYRPHLDGLRALAVYLVVAFHAGVGRASGGFVGVDVFFVLSGYLVTGLLIRDLDGPDRRVRFGRFYSRRVRRLLPAAAVNLVVTAIVFGAVAAPVELADAQRAIRAAALYVANWHFISQSADYFAVDVESSPVAHYWSLSVEEQFYVVWPVLLAGIYALARRRRGSERRVVQGAIALGALGSFVLARSLAGPDISRAYQGTDTRAYQLLAGALLAVTPGIVGPHRSVARRVGAACGGRRAGGGGGRAGVEPGGGRCDLARPGGHGGHGRADRGARRARGGRCAPCSRGLPSPTWARSPTAPTCGTGS